MLLLAACAASDPPPADEGSDTGTSDWEASAPIPCETTTLAEGPFVPQGST
ncbi:MAG: hypothetical protein FJ090_21895 [Deltaproteobacteria bacterium]|nr:hypothetical protein [Deltaproteobacteria bacterium]